jgi:hypothetical protein
MSYSGDPSNSPKDAVRFLIGDDTTPEVFTDTEILFMLEQEGNFWLASATLCERAQASKSGGALISKRVGGLSESYSEAATWYATQASYYRRRGTVHAVPTFTEEAQIFSFRQFDIPGFPNPPLRKRGSVPAVNEELE